MAGGIGLSLAGGCLVPSRTDSCPDGRGLSLDAASEAHVSNEFSTPLDGLSYATRTVVSDALDADDGRAADRGYYPPDPPTPYVVEGSEPRYYGIETTDREVAEAPGYAYTVDTVDEPSSADGDRIRPFAELPLHDRESLRSAVGNAGLIHAPHYAPFSVTFAYERGDARDRSAFVPEADGRYLRWDDVLLRLRFDERRTVAITSATVATELVAESPAAFRAHVGGERGVVLDSLSSRQREIVERAIDGEYSECRPYSEAFGDLRRRFSTSDDGVAPLARYDADWYFATLG